MKSPRLTGADLMARRARAGSTDPLPKIIQGVQELEQLSLGLARLSEGELALVFTLMADQHAELRRLLRLLVGLRGVRRVRVARTVD